MFAAYIDGPFEDYLAAIQRDDGRVRTRGTAAEINAAANVYGINISVY